MRPIKLVTGRRKTLIPRHIVRTVMMALFSESPSVPKKKSAAKKSAKKSIKKATVKKS